MKFKKDRSDKEYTTAAGAAKFLDMPRTSFLYFYDERNLLNEQFKPEYRVYNGKRVWYKEHLEKWLKKTSNVLFSHKKKKSKVTNETNQSNITKFPTKSK